MSHALLLLLVKLELVQALELGLPTRARQSSFASCAKISLELRALLLNGDAGLDLVLQACSCVMASCSAVVASQSFCQCANAWTSLGFMRREPAFLSRRFLCW